MKFVKSVSITFVTKSFLIVVGLVTSVLTARYLGPAGKGVLAVLTVIQSVALQFGGLGIHSANTYFIAKDNRNIAPVAAHSLLFGLGMGSILAVAVLGFGLAFPSCLKGMPLLYLALIALPLPFVLSSNLFQNIVLGLKRVVVYNAFEIAGSVTGLISVVLALVILGAGVKLLLVFMAVVSIGISASFVAYTIRRIVRVELRTDTELLKSSIRFGLKSYTACIFSYLVIKADILLINYFQGFAPVGVYSIASRVADLMLLFPQVVGVMLFPWISAEKEEGSVFMLKVSRGTSWLLLPVLAVVFFVSPFVVRLLYGGPFMGSIQPIRILLPGIFFYAMMGIYSNYLAGRGFPPVAVLAPMSACVANLGLNWIWIPEYGISGAALASTVSYGIGYGILLVAIKRRDGVKWHEFFIGTIKKKY